PARPAHRQGRPVREHAADGASAHAERVRGPRRPDHCDRRPEGRQRGSTVTSTGTEPTKHITHWIGGKPWDGQAERQGDVYDPATGRGTGDVGFPSPGEGEG